jgi:hypothetical protein
MTTSTDYSATASIFDLALLTHVIVCCDWLVKWRRGGIKKWEGRFKKVKGRFNNGEWESSDDEEEPNLIVELP